MPRRFWIPYSGQDDPGLPEDIKKLPANKRRQFSTTWNSAYANCRDKNKGGGAGNAADCEGIAFRFARSAVKEMVMEEDSKEGRMISTVNLKKIRDALTALNELLSAAEPPALTGKELEVGVEVELDANDFVQRDHETGLVERIISGVKGILFGGAEEEGEEELETGSKPYPNEHAARVRDPGDFEANSFRSKELPKANGVRIILGRLKGQTTTTTQAYRFPIESFTADEAKTWLKDHDVKGASFEPAKKAEKDIVGSFTAFKDDVGLWRWISLTSNKFKDREGEIFSAEAHKEYVEYATAFKHFPELWLWHTPGSKLGMADFVDYTDGFVVHSGTFDEGKEAVAASLAATKDLAVSHGFKYRAADKEDGVYEWYRTFEVSALPAARAANAWTEILSKKEVVMSFSEAKKAFLTKHLGEEAVTDIESRVAGLSKQLEEAGVEFKDLVDDATVPEEKAEVGETVTVPDGNTSAPAGDNMSAQLQDIATKLDALADVPARLEAIEQVTKTQAGELVGMKERLTAAERTDAQKIDDQVAPRRPAPGNGEGPANSEDTLVDADKQAALEEAAKKAAAGGKDPYIGPYVDDLIGGRLVGGGVVTSGE